MSYQKDNCPSGKICHKGSVAGQTAGALRDAQNQDQGSQAAHLPLSAVQLLAPDFHHPPSAPGDFPAQTFRTLTVTNQP
jgi:hypothetical protein